jgi:hypothetical protein
MNKLLDHIFAKKYFQKKPLPKIYIGQDPDPDINRPDQQHCRKARPTAKQK